MDRMIAHCGLVCTDCPAYIATKANSDEMREEVARKWSTEYGASVTKDDVYCDGCLSLDGRVYAYCTDCKIRSCAIERKVANCGSCPDYACEQLHGFFEMVPAAKETLDGVRIAGRRSPHEQATHPGDSSLGSRI